MRACVRARQGMSAQPRKYLSIVQSLQRVVAEEGVLGLYRGNMANVVRVVPTYGFKFAFNDWFRDVVAPGVAKPTTLQLMASGTLAGLSQVCGLPALLTPRLARAGLNPCTAWRWWQCALWRWQGAPCCAQPACALPVAASASWSSRTHWR